MIKRLFNRSWDSPVMMTWLNTVVRAFALTVLLESFSAIAATEFYVATNGNDRWSGQLAEPNPDKTDGPFVSIEKARNEIRRRKESSGLKAAVTVYVRRGRYALPAGLKFEAQDSGSEMAPITYCSYKAEKPVLIGGKIIDGFIPYKGKILKVELSTQGLQGVYFRQLIFNGFRQPLARFPNFDPRNPYTGGWAYAAGEPVSMYTDIPGEDRRSFICKPSDLRTWARPSEVAVFVFARYNWWNDICPIREVDPVSRKITLSTDASYSIRAGDRYYFQNALEELDAPGEWYLDRQTWTLYFWPPTPIDGGEVLAPTTRTILELGRGTAYLTFRGFTLECAEGTAIVLNETKHCLIAANTIRNVGDYYGSGVEVNDGVQNGITGNDIAATGSHAISLSGGDRTSLTPGGNYADNNYLHHFGVFYKQGVGIKLSGVGNRASHNLIHDGPRMGILILSGNNLIIEFNHIHHVNLETEDTGAIYTTGRDWLSPRGTVIRYNYIHDIAGFGRDDKGRWVSTYFAWGIYLDDNSGGADVIGNIIVRCSQAGLHLNNARDNHISNNVFVENGQQQIDYNGWTAVSKMWRTHLPTMIKGYAIVERSSAWRAFRHMEMRPENAPLPNGLIMTGNEFVRNIIYYQNPAANYFKCVNVPFARNVIDTNLIWHFGLPVRIGKVTDAWTSWQIMGLDRHSLVADPLFVNPARDDYRLKPESPAYKLGFKPIPISRVGLYPDRLRATWPVDEAVGAREQAN